VTGAARTAGADEPVWRLDYTAPAGCPSRDQARGQIVARLGFDPFAEKEASSTLRMTVAHEPSGAGLRVRVERLDDAHSAGERELTDLQGNCTELIAAAAFAASLLVDPTGAMRRRLEPRTEGAPDVRPTRADDPFAPGPPETPAPVPPPPAQIRPLLGARAIGSVGLAPSASLGASLEAGIALARWSVRVEGRADFPAEGALLADGTGARSSLLLGAIVPCYAIGVARVCAVGMAGAMLAESVNISPVERDRTFFAAVGLRGGAELPLGRTVSVVGHVDALVPLRRLTIRTQGVEVWTAPAVAASLGVGLVVQLL
jgi:hypothetical protein